MIGLHICFQSLIPAQLSATADAGDKLLSPLHLFLMEPQRVQWFFIVL